MPVATEAPMRSVSGSISIPESSSAIRAAAMTIWANRSIFRALRYSIHLVGSKSFSSHAKCTAYPEGSKAWIGAAPLSPAVKFFQKVSASFPSGVTAPTPVTTTRFLPFVLISHPQATVDEQHLARNERGLVRAEKAYRTGHIVRLAQTAEGSVLEDQPARLFRKDVCELGGDVPGRDRVDAHAAGTELARGRLREPDDARLRSGVVCLAGISMHANDTREVHDRSRAAAEHLAGDSARGVERTAQICVDHRLPVLIAHPRAERVAGDS